MKSIHKAYSKTTTIMCSYTIRIRFFIINIVIVKLIHFMINYSWYVKQFMVDKSLFSSTVFFEVFLPVKLLLLIFILYSYDLILYLTVLFFNVIFHLKFLTLLELRNRKRGNIFEVLC